MKQPEKIVLSASRRTDIPAFYMGWFMQGIQTGSFVVENPFNRRKSIVEADPERVHSIVFWSKNFGPFLEGGFGKMLLDAGYNSFFHFTINSVSHILEPGLPALKQRIEQAGQLARLFGPRAVCWRFDPICFFKQGDGPVHNNLGDFEKIASSLAEFGISRCTVSFLDYYAKIDKRLSRHPGLAFVLPDAAKKAQILCSLAQKAAPFGMELFTCCEKQAATALPEGSAIRAGACIDHKLLESLYGPGLNSRQDKGQRTKAGCGCNESRDIGSYNLQPCGHKCLFCYANPAAIG
ncbi:MAG: DUF1848 domain-containing protein [Desulfatibacillaceae bacterium]|nr:DUF1848 domain-containing protein [Desulfatibacillaceae bacterium]